MAERVALDPTGQAHIEGEADVTLYAGGLYPIRVPVSDVPFRLWQPPVLDAFVRMGATSCST